MESTLQQITETKSNFNQEQISFTRASVDHHDVDGHHDGHQHAASEWKRNISTVFWQGGSNFDAWLNASSVQVAQVLLTFPYSFAQMGLCSGVTFMVLYGLMGCWASYMITCLYADYRSMKQKQNFTFHNHTIQWFEVLEGLLGPWWRAIGIFFNAALLFCTASIQLIACGSNVYYIYDKLNKRSWIFIFGACCSLNILIPSVRNYRMWSFVGIIMTSYTAWYLTIAALVQIKDPNVTHIGAQTTMAYFTGATNFIYAFGGHAVTVEIMDAMHKPEKFKTIYLYAILYIFTLTLPSSITVYWRFGDTMLSNTNALSVMPKNQYRDAAVVLMLIHQFIEFGLLTLPMYLMWEKCVGVHNETHFSIKAAARVPIVAGITFCAVMIPYFGPINSAVGSMLTSFSIYVIPCVAHMIFYWSSDSRSKASEQPPFWLRNWTVMYCINMGIVLWVFVIGVGFGSWASIHQISIEIRSSGLFAECYQCSHPN